MDGGGWEETESKRGKFGTRLKKKYGCLVLNTGNIRGDKKKVLRNAMPKSVRDRRLKVAF